MQHRMSTGQTILVVDDEPSINLAIDRVFRDTDVRVITATSMTEGEQAFKDNQPDVAIFDVHLPDGSGMDLFSSVKQIEPRIPVILMTGHATNETAIEAMRQGAFDYLFKPLDAHELEDLVHKAIRVSIAQREPIEMQGESKQVDEEARQIIGKSASMREIYKTIGRVADNDVTVLITGESGVGKELVARAIYQHSSRSGQVFVPVNCAAIPEALLESEIFGHEKGAFTGADSRRIGKFEQCNGGTLFLDEVGEMSPLTQAKLLRVIEQQNFERVGSNDTISTDVRLIAATNRNLERMMKSGDFREDLYYRLCDFEIRIPPLRDRLDDIPELVAYLLHRLNREMNKSIQEVSDSALARLSKYSWPGNVRELQSYIRQWILVTNGPRLTVDQMPKLVERSLDTDSGAQDPFEAANIQKFVADQMDSGTLHADFIASAERKLFETVLRETSGNLSKASRILGINRRTLRTKLQSLGIKSD